MKTKTYTFDEAYQASLEYFKGDELAAKVWVSKYALKDSQGEIYEKTPEDMHWRLAREIARIEKKYANPLSEGELFNLFDRFRVGGLFHAPGHVAHLPAFQGISPESR